MGQLIDTSVLIALEREVASPTLEELVRSDENAVSVISVSELLQGVHRASDQHRARRRLLVDRMIQLFPPLPIDLEVARVHSDLWAQMSSDGSMIDAHDLWIAATALAHDFAVITLNAKDFTRVPGLQVLTA